MSAPDWMSGASKGTDRKATRIQVTAEQRRLDQAAAVEVRTAELALDRERRTEKERARQERAQARRQNRTALFSKVTRTAPVVGRRVMIVGPILAPMSVAWIGQIGFAKSTLGWTLAGAIVFAAAWEMSTAFCGWMYHQARDDGDQGTIFRAATWFFAGAAGGMNYWHALPAGHHLTDPTPKAASFGAMSLAGIALWELYTLLIHRKALRRHGKLPQSRPRFGLARWTQYGYTTWIARSLSIKHGYTTVEQAWSAALTEKDRRAARKAPTTGRTPVRVTVVHGPRTRVSVAPLTTWTQPPTVWVPVVSRVGPVAAESTLELTAEPTPETTSEPSGGTTPGSTPETTVEPSSESTAGTTRETTVESSPETTQESTSESTRRTTRKSTRKVRGKGRRTRDELRVEIEVKVAEHYRNGGGELEVAPLARELKATRKTVRELLAEMNVRPIRKEAAG